MHIKHELTLFCLTLIHLSETHRKVHKDSVVRMYNNI